MCHVCWAWVFPLPRAHPFSPPSRPSRLWPLLETLPVGVKSIPAPAHSHDWVSLRERRHLAVSLLHQLLCCRCRLFSYVTWKCALLCPYLEMKAEVEERPLNSVGTMRGRRTWEWVLGSCAGVRAWVSVRWDGLRQRVKGESGAHLRHRISQLEDRKGRAPPCSISVFNLWFILLHIPQTRLYQSQTVTHSNEYLLHPGLALGSA